MIKPNEDLSLNELNVLNELKHDLLKLMNNCSFAKIQKYKAFIDQTDQRINQIVKQISKLTELFDELKKFFQSKKEIGEQISEPIKNISMIAHNLEMNFMFEKLADLNRIIFENSNNFIEKFFEITLNPLDQLLKNFNTIEIENCKKNVDKAFRAFEAKLSNQSKKRKSMDLTNMNIQTDEIPIENSNLTQKICEYLMLINRCKTSSLNQFSNSLIDFYKTQIVYYKSSLDKLNSLMNNLDQRKISNSLLSFNLNQSEEKKLLDDVAEILSKIPKPKHHRTSSYFFNLTERFSSSFQSQSDLSIVGNDSAKISSCPFTTTDMEKFNKNSNIDSSKSSMSSWDLRPKNSKFSSNEKSGYLFKRTHNSKVRKHWIKRKCKAVNGHFFIYHSDETLEPVKLNLITCSVKPLDTNRFKIFSGSNSRIYEFMCEYENDFLEWISILNTAKNKAFEKEMSDSISVSTITNTTTNISSESNSSTLKNEKDNEKAYELLVKNMLKQLLKIDGNKKCADCDSDDPDWLVTNLGIFVCIECCGIHREMGVQISKTQSIKIDRLNASQLIIAKMIGNSKLNSIFECTLDKSQKLNPSSTMDQRQKYLRAKYEHHSYAKIEYSNEILCNFIEFFKQNDFCDTFDFLIKIFAQNIDLLQPVPGDEKSRNILQLLLENFDESDSLLIIDFLIQNRDFPKNKYKIDYQDIDGNTALHYCALYNRIDSTKLLLKSNANYKIKNQSGLTPIEIADNLTNIECENQISLFSEGKPMEKIDWIHLFELDFDKNESEVNKLETAIIDKPVNHHKDDRPISMVIATRNLGCSRTKKIHNYHRQQSESFNSINMESYFKVKKENNSLLPPFPTETRRKSYEEKKYEHRSLENLDKELYIDENEIGKKMVNKKNNRYTSIIDYVPLNVNNSVHKLDPGDNDFWLNEDKFYSKL
ncbi:unnamed protein product [Brachionus calyciflorus]|uniref:Uncharacterized protein n=1 Tax=Brachionus calyciflorus TaxID=104777 RepID=A0A813MXS3_9BILA|nr:unnamed protein product [Brachionus calyciflorus]